MSEHDALIRAFAEGFSERDLSRARALMHDDVVFDWTRSMADNHGVYRGYETVQRLFQSFIEAWERVNLQVVEIEDVGTDRLLVDTRLDARGRDSGIDVSGTGAQVWDLHDGKIARVTLFQNRGDALAALAGGDLD
jgi:ketosteroid isomerase-like protein